MGNQNTGYESCARQFIATRDIQIGVSTLREWAVLLPPGSSILDLGCGHGRPVSETLIASGFDISGIDASPTLISEFKQRFPNASPACEPVEESSFFGRTFDGVVAIGLLFLLESVEQERLLRRVAEILNSGGRFLFTAPVEVATWRDMITGGPSVSLGDDEYRRILTSAGFKVEGEYVDEGQNHYYACVREAPAVPR